MRNVMIGLIVLLLIGCDQTVGSMPPDGGADTDTDSDTDNLLIEENPDLDTDCSGDGVCSEPPWSYCINSTITIDGVLVENPIMLFNNFICLDEECIYLQHISGCDVDCVVVDGGPDYCQE